MIKGIGIDMTRISRIEKACRNPHFTGKIYTEQEILLYGKFPARLAGNFAVKEAVVKAFGTGFRSFYPVEIEVLRDDLGKPYVNLYGEAEKLKERLGITSLYVSITNEDDYVSAVAVAEGER